MYQLQHFLHAAFALSLVDLLNFQGIANVFSNGHMGPYSIGLEYHADIAFFRRSKGALNRGAYALLTNVNFALGSAFKSCNHTQGGGFAAAGGTKDGDEFAILNN